MALFKDLKALKEGLKHYEDMVPVNNMGKWMRSIAINKYIKQIKDIERELKARKNRLVF